MVKKLKILVITLLMGVTLPVFSQTQGVLGKRFFDNWSIGIGGGPDIFFGDLKTNAFWPSNINKNEIKFGGTATLTKQFTHVFSLRGQFLYSEISGTKRYSRVGEPINQYFDGNIMESNLNATINFSNLFARGYKPTRKFFIFGSIGLGTMTWNSKVKELDTGTPLRSSDSLGRWTTALSASVSIGAYVNLGDKVNIGLEWSLHPVNSDMLDATKSGYLYDAHSMVALTVTYNFNKRNPGKVPDANLNKPVVPAPPLPVPEVKQPEPELPDVLPVTDTIKVDTLDRMNDFPAEQDTTELVATQETGIVFRVQLFALKSDRYTAQEVREKYKLDGDVYKDFSDNWYRYTTGSYTSYAEAKAMKNQMRRRGFRGAFVARFNNGIRVPAHGKK